MPARCVKRSYKHNGWCVCVCLSTNRGAGMPLHGLSATALGKQQTGSRVLPGTKAATYNAVINALITHKSRCKRKDLWFSRRCYSSVFRQSVLNLAIILKVITGSSEMREGKKIRKINISNLFSLYCTKNNLFKQ